VRNESASPSEAERLLNSKSEADDNKVICNGDEADFIKSNFGANGRVTRIAEAIPIVGQAVAGAQLLSGNTREAKRALAKSTKATVMGSVAAGAAVTGGAFLGAYSAAAGIGGAALGAVGLFGGAVAGSAAGELVGGASQALVEATVFNDDDRRTTGTEYLTRTPAQWTAGVAVASTAGAVSASIGLQVNCTMLSGRIEQKVAAELAEAAAGRAIAPHLERRPSSKRRRELARLDVDDSMMGTEDQQMGECGCEPPMPRRTRSGGYGEL